MYSLASLSRFSATSCDAPLYRRSPFLYSTMLYAYRWFSSNDRFAALWFWISTMFRASFVHVSSMEMSGPCYDAVRQRGAHVREQDHTFFTGFCYRRSDTITPTALRIASQFEPCPLAFAAALQTNALANVPQNNNDGQHTRSHGGLLWRISGSPEVR